MPKKVETTAPEIDDGEDIYAVLGVDKAASVDDIKKAYRKLALRLHPDKIATDASEDERAAQTAQFQRLSLYYAILTDEAKRARYDATGSVSEASSSILEGFAASGREWDEYFNELYGGIVTTAKIDEFAEEYRGSDEEKRDLANCYKKAGGDMDKIMETMMLAEVDEEARLRDIIASLFASGELEPTPAWKKTTTKAAIKRRQTEAADEAAEAEKHAKELGLNDKLKKVSGEEELMALMKANSERRMGALISNLEAKYAGGGKKEKGKRSKKAAEESEEENVDKDDSPPKKRKSTRAR